MPPQDRVRIRILALVGSELYDIGEATVDGMCEARVELPALLREVAATLEQPDPDTPST